MLKKLTITIDEDVYNGLYKVIGKRKVGHFLEELACPHVIHPELEAAYQEMAHDEERENEFDRIHLKKTVLFYFNQFRISQHQPFHAIFIKINLYSGMLTLTFKC